MIVGRYDRGNPYSHTSHPLIVILTLSPPPFPFLSMEQERGLRRSILVQHISVARKVNAFLKTSSRSSVQKVHCDRMEEWLNTLSVQIGHVLPPPPVKVSPSLPPIHKWVRGLTAGAHLIMDGTVPLTKESCQQVQAALLSQLVVGNECTSPLRLGIIRTLRHPCKVNQWVILLLLLL